MTIFECTVPFKEVTADIHGIPRRCILSTPAEISGITITRTGEITYDAKLTLESSAARIFDAADEAKARVADILLLFAVENDAFEIDKDKAPDCRRLTGPWPGGIETAAALANSSQRKDVEAEQFAASWRDEWPAYVPIILTLNYVATISQDQQIALRLYTTALEILIEQSLGPVGTVLSLPDKPQKEKFKRELRALLSDYGIDRNGADRVVGRMFETENESKIDRTKRMLEQVGIPASESDIRLMTTRRGKTTHTADGDTELQTASEFARVWVQTALRNILKRGVGQV